MAFNGRSKPTLTVGLPLLLTLSFIHSGLSASQPALPRGEILAELAKASLGPKGSLTHAEEAMLSAVATGSVARCGSEERLDSTPPDRSYGASWGPERSIRAELIRWVFVNPEAAKAVAVAGLNVDGARISGLLDLSYLTLPGPLRLMDCSIPGAINLHNAHAPAIDLHGSLLGPFLAKRSVILGDLVLAHTFTNDLVDLSDTEIKGDLDFGGAYALGPNSEVNASVAAIGQNVYFIGSRFDKTVVLDDAQIGGDINFKDALFVGPRPIGMRAARATIGRLLYWVPNINRVFSKSCGNFLGFFRSPGACR